MACGGVLSTARERDGHHQREAGRSQDIRPGNGRDDAHDHHQHQSGAAGCILLLCSSEGLGWLGARCRAAQLTGFLGVWAQAPPLPPGIPPTPEDQAVLEQAGKVK